MKPAQSLDVADDSALARELATDYHLSAEHRSDVLEFLEDRPHLRPLLREAPAHIHRCFRSAKLLLELTVDPEIEDLVTLWIVVQTTMSVPDALAAYDLLGKSWWLDAMMAARDDLEIEPCVI